MAQILVAPDKFKGSADAPRVAAAIVAGMRAVDSDLDVDAVPIADGGEGTLHAALAAGFARVPVVASGPVGDPVWTGYARRDNMAVIETADVSGLVRLPGGRPAPLVASSRGAGARVLDRRGRQVTGEPL